MMLTVKGVRQMIKDGNLLFINSLGKRKRFSILGCEFTYSSFKSRCSTMLTEDGKEKSKVAVFKKKFETGNEMYLFLRHFCYDVLKNIGTLTDYDYSENEDIIMFKDNFSYSILEDKYTVKIQKDFCMQEELLLFIENNVRQKADNRARILRDKAEKSLIENSKRVLKEYETRGIIKSNERVRRI